MARREEWSSNQATLMMITMVLLVAVTVSTTNDAVIPAEKSKLTKWFNDNVRSFTERKSLLDPALIKAEEGAAKVVKVMQNGGGDYKKITDAINGIPAGNSKRVIVYIGGGTYNEKVTIPRNKPFVTFFGNPKNMPIITFNGDAAKYGTVDSATLIVMSDYFVGVNLNIKNSSPKPDGKRKGAQALALKLSGTKAAIYNCKFYGFQDTICDDKGHHFFKDSYVEGTYDFIFRSGKSIYLNTELHVIQDPGLTVITAQARDAKEDTGYSFVHCKVTGTGKNAYLGRAWRAAPRVIYAYTEMGANVNSEGWTNNKHPEYDKTVHFGEYKNTRPGANMRKRVKYTKILSEADVKQFISLSWIEGSKWLLPPPTPRV